LREPHSDTHGLHLTSAARYSGHTSHTSPKPHRLTSAETSLQTHDIELATTQRNGHPRKLRLLILSARSTTPAHLSSTTARLSRLSGLGSAHITAILYLAHHRGAAPPQPVSFTPARAVHAAAQTHGASAAAGLVALQQLLLESRAPLPVLPVAGAGALLPALRAFVAGAAVPPPELPVPRAVGDLLPWCVVGAEPLGEDARAALADCFACLRDLAHLEPHRERGWVVEALVGSGVEEDVVRSVLEFWDEEVVVEA